MTSEQILKIINKIGAKCSSPYICIDPKVKMDSMRSRHIKVKNLITGDIKVIRSSSIINKGVYPFYTKKCGGKRSSNSEIEKQINKLGSKTFPKYKCVSTDCGYQVRAGSGQKHRLVKIQCLDTKKIKKVELSNLKRGQNPFRCDQNRLEVEKVQPMYEKLLTKLKIKYQKEFCLGKKRIDFMFIIDGKKYGLEVKQSDKWYSEKNQMETYKLLSKRKKYKLSQILLSDPEGKHKDKGSLSIKELKYFLENL